MYRLIAKVTALTVLLIAGSTGLWVYQKHFSTEQKIQRLEEEKRELKRFVERLTQERRVAEVLVTDQSTDENGKVQTSLLFVEYLADGTPLPAKTFRIEGTSAHIDSLVIKFDDEAVMQDDLLRGHSIVLFYRIFGDFQSPSEAFFIDAPGEVPDVYRTADPRVGAFQAELWKNFWRLTTDEKYRTEMGVRVANPESPWGPFELNRIYSLKLELDGGINITSEPLKGIYREALKRSPAEAAHPAPAHP